MYSNYAVGYNNVDVKAATKHHIAVGNTPGESLHLLDDLILAAAIPCHFSMEF